MYNIIYLHWSSLQIINILIGLSYCIKIMSKLNEGQKLVNSCTLTITCYKPLKLKL